MTRRYAPKLKGDDRTKVAATLAARYTAGATIRQLAEETGRSYGGVRQLLAEGKATFRRPGTSPKPA